MYEDRIYQLELKVNILNKQVKEIRDSLPTIHKTWIRPCELGNLIGVSARQISRYREQGVFKKDSYRYVGIRYEYHNVKALADFENKK
tara:strand:- start:529 stop:792 length:264 start_codon:yes stop_codon:yes gene_type:complete